ncbi:MAG: manganese efflux pump MntP [Candidimonas sp.]
MSFISLLFVALAMSTDAFAAAVAKGAGVQKPKFRDALRAGVIFGVIEAITPAIGWGIGHVASQFISAWDHWVAFSLLLALGLHMIYQGLKTEDASQNEKVQKHAFGLLAVTAFATSIDALAVGVGLAFVDVNIVLASCAIGLMTLVMVVLGFMLGRVIGTVLGRKAEILGGVVLIVIGSLILFEHLGPRTTAFLG